MQGSCSPFAFSSPLAFLAPQPAFPSPDSWSTQEFRSKLLEQTASPARSSGKVGALSKAERLQIARLPQHLVAEQAVSPEPAPFHVQQFLSERSGYSSIQVLKCRAVCRIQRLADAGEPCVWCCGSAVLSVRHLPWIALSGTRGWISSKFCQHISKRESDWGKFVHFPSEWCRPVWELVIACYFIPSVFPYSLELSLLSSTFFTVKPYMFLWIEVLSLENLGRDKHLDIFEGLVCVWRIRFIV